MGTSFFCRNPWKEVVNSFLKIIRLIFVPGNTAKERVLMDYDVYWKQRERDYEAFCRRCGGCCGAYDDPCVHLRKSGEQYFCEIYQSRLGTRRTVAGEVFDCVPVREVLNEYWKNDYLCGYKRLQKE